MQWMPRIVSPGRRFAAAALFVVTGAAGAALPAARAGAQTTTTVNFNGLTVTDGSGVRYVNNCYTESGFQVTAVGVACGTANTFATGGPASPLFYTGSPALFLNHPTATQVDFTSVAGDMFGLQSIGLGAFLGASANVTLVGSLMGGGTVMQMFSVGRTPLMTSFAVGPAFTGLTAVRLSATNEFGEPIVQFDNLVFSTAATAVIPEPGTVFLVGAGLAGAGLAARRRRADRPSA